NYPNGDIIGSTHDFKKKVYYVKKEARYQDQIYYLLSTERSSVNGIIGWVDKRKLNIHNHVFVDSDRKSLFLTGKGAAYSHPWGGRKQRMIDNLNKYKNYAIQVLSTEYVGKNLWYEVELENNLVWINYKYVKQKR